MSAKWTAEERATKNKLAAAKSKVRELLVAKKTDKALAHAEASGFDVFLARLAPTYRNAAEPMFAALEEAMVAKAKGLDEVCEIRRRAHFTEHDFAAKVAERAQWRGDEPDAELVAPAPIVTAQEPAQIEPEIVEVLGGDAHENGTVRTKIETVPVIPPEAVSPAIPPEPPPNPWPVETEAVIHSFCPNQRLVVIRLPDGRTASMWRGAWRKWNLRDKLTAKLDVASADPVYASVRVPGGTF